MIVIMPAWIDDVARPIKALSALFEGIAKVDDFARQYRRNKRFSDLLGALKVLYFSPQGSLGILTKIANGEPVSDVDIERMHRTVSDDTNINHALRVLVLDELRRWPELPVKDFGAISYLKYGKADLRVRLARYAREYQRLTDHVDRRNTASEERAEVQRVARQLLADIGDLNAALEALDSQLRRS